MEPGEVENKGHCRIPGMAHRPRNCTHSVCNKSDRCESSWPATDHGKPHPLYPPERFMTQGELNYLNNCGDVRQAPGMTDLMISPEVIDAALASAPLPLVLHGLVMPKDSRERKRVPLCTGVLDYFPAALAEVAKLSQFGNDKHNPGEPLHWARGKSMDHADCLLRHLADRGMIDPDSGLSHTVEVAWRALALLQEECEARGASQPRGAR